MSFHERLEREIAIAEGAGWLGETPAAAALVRRVAGAYYYDGAWSDGAGLGDILTTIREPDNPHDPNAIAMWSAVAQVGHVSADLAAWLAPLLDAGHPLWAQVCQPATADQPGIVVVKFFGPANEIGGPSPWR